MNVTTKPRTKPVCTRGPWVSLGGRGNFITAGRALRTYAHRNARMGAPILVAGAAAPALAQQTPWVVMCNVPRTLERST